MSISLQEQLLKAGLVNEKQVKQVKKEKRKGAKQQKHQQKHQQEPVVDLAKQAAEQAKKEKAERDRKLNEERNQRAERRAVIAQIKQLIDNSKVDRSDGETAYNFVENNKVKKLYVTETQHRQLSLGQLAIVSFQKSHELVPAAVGHKIAERDSSCVIMASEKSAIQEAEDEYADYKIPDDLMW